MKDTVPRAAGTSIVYLLVFATGAAGLVYQVAWQRYLARLLGSDAAATAMILATFLGGLSLGYLLCGRLTVRVRDHLRAYALLELTIGAWCLLFPMLFETVDQATRSWSFAVPWAMVFEGVPVAALLTGVPTLCMGATVPFLTRGLSTSLDRATRVHAIVYSLNTAGAFAGTILAGFVLVPVLGLPVTVMGTALVNLAAGGAFILLSGRPAGTPGPPEQPPAPARPDPSGAPIGVLYSVALLSGFTVMTLENALTRLAGISLGSSSYCFTLVVAVFVLSIALGSFAVARLERIPRWLLAANQALVAASLLAVYATLDLWPWAAHQVRISFSSDGSSFIAYHATVLAALAALLVVPVSLMGATLPIAFNELKRDLTSVGRSAGTMLSFNTLGSLIGSLAGGYLLYAVMDLPRVFLLSVLVAMASSALASWRLGPRVRWASVAALAPLVVLLVATPWFDGDRLAIGTFRLREAQPYSHLGPARFYEAFRGGDRILLRTDGPTTSVTVLESEDAPALGPRSRAILVNGKSDSSALGDAYNLKMCAHLPLLLAKKRDNVLVVGLGTGVTAAQVAQYDDVRHIRVAEISPVVTEVLPLFSEFNGNIADDPRLRIDAADAYRVLGRSGMSWDVVISEPSNPWVVGVDMLFTREFYARVREKLAPGGVFVQWIHTYSSTPEIVGMVANTVASEFAEVRVFMANPVDLVIVATAQPLTRQDVQRAERVLAANPAARASLEAIDLRSLDALLVREIWTSEIIGSTFQRAGLQTMDNPRLHYQAGRAFFEGTSMDAASLFFGHTSAHSDSYLMALEHPGWTTWDDSGVDLQALAEASVDRVTGWTLPMLPALRLRAHIEDPAHSPLSARERALLGTDLVALMMSADVTQEDWERAGLGTATTRERAEVLLHHLHRTRSWIAPYPLDGLEALMRQGRDLSTGEAERNWYALNLAQVLLLDGGTPGAVQTILASLSRDALGRIVADPETEELLLEVKLLVR